MLTGGLPVTLDLSDEIWIAVFDPPFEVIGNFLTQDVGKAVASCRHYLNESLAAILPDSGGPIQLLGNGHKLVVTQQWTFLESIFGTAQSVTFDSDLLIEALRYWEGVIERKSSNGDEEIPEFAYVGDPFQVSPTVKQAEMLIKLYDEDL
ncbi:hypothetical protein [Stieleria varia]|uniref:Uncharacterized protein n=1 Tax=Stieleria varia TaxID=2528005 RepID=A0A5C6AZH2_9BACT|nr:hypothetical protein [Stieleria varia]TWU04416.1 hypothetical protein Pla52n_24560 [Stieleria varia]